MSISGDYSTTITADFLVSYAQALKVSVLLELSMKIIYSKLT